MNNRIFLAAIIFAVSSAISAFGQSVPAASSARNAGSSTSGAQSAGAASTALPDEHTLIIGSGSSGQSPAIKPVHTVGVWDFVQMILVLALVVAGIYLLFYFLKRAGGVKNRENELITVLSAKPLQSNRSLYLIEAGGKIFLVGSSEGSISLVSAIEDKEAVDDIRLKASANGSNGEHRAFRDAFSRAFLRTTGGGGLSGSGSFLGSMNFLKQQRERLKKF